MVCVLYPKVHKGFRLTEAFYFPTSVETPLSKTKPSWSLHGADRIIAAPTDQDHISHPALYRRADRSQKRNGHPLFSGLRFNHSNQMVILKDPVYYG